MRYYRRLYWGEDLKKKKEKIIRRLNTGKLQRDIYVLVLPEHGSNQLEIYNAFDKLMENGKDGIQFEIITLRGGARIPLLYE